MILKTKVLVNTHSKLIGHELQEALYKTWRHVSYFSISMFGLTNLKNFPRLIHTWPDDVRLHSNCLENNLLPFYLTQNFDVYSILTDFTSFFIITWSLHQNILTFCSHINETTFPKVTNENKMAFFFALYFHPLHMNLTISATHPWNSFSFWISVDWTMALTYLCNLLHFFLLKSSNFIKGRQ